MRAAFIWGLTLAVCEPTVALAALPLQVERVAAPAQLLRGAKKTQLTPHKALEAGDRVSIGRGGRAGLKLVPSGELLLGEDSELFVHSADAGIGEAGAIVRLALVRGSLHLDSLARDGQPPQDMRLNVGTLRVRVLGSEVWAGVEPGQNETICLLQGSADISTDFGSERLDVPGDCLRYGANNVRMRLKPENDGVLARKLARTAFAGERPLAAPPITAAAPQVAVAAPTPLAPPAPAAPPAPTPVAQAATPAAPPAPEVVPASAPEPLPMQAPASAPARATPTRPTVMPAVVTAAARMSPPVTRTPAPPESTPAPPPVVAGAPPAAASPAPASASPPPVRFAPPVPAPTALTPAPVPNTAAPVRPATGGKGEWTVVVLSVRSIGSARDEVARLGSRGLPAEMHPAGNMNRVTIGRFNSRESAHEYAAEMLEREHLKAWVTQIE